MNGLRKRSQLMVDKLFTVPIGDIGSSIGCLETTVMAELDLALRDWLALYCKQKRRPIACLKRLLQRRYNERNASGPRARADSAQLSWRSNSPMAQPLQRQPHEA